MKKLAAVLALSTTAVPALAADMIMPPPPPVYVAPPTWTGLYIGGQAGYAFNGGGSGGPSDVFIRIPGTPGDPGTPGEPGTPPVVVPGGTAELSAACAAAGAALACSGAIEIDGQEFLFEDATAAEISAAVAAVGGDLSEDEILLAAAAGAIAIEFETEPRVVVPGEDGLPGTPGTPGTDEEIIDVSDLDGISSFEDDSDGFIGGIHVGYDAQLGYDLGGGALVLGVVGDLSYVDVERFGGLRGLGEEISIREELDYLATVRARLGIGYERALVYATGGLAFGKVETTYVNTLFDDGGSDDDTRVGYAVGAGVDFLVARNFSLGVEYLYTDLGDGDGVSASYDLGGGSTFEVESDEDFDFHTVWAKASFRFN